MGEVMVDLEVQAVPSTRDSLLVEAADAEKIRTEAWCSLDRPLFDPVDPEESYTCLVCGETCKGEELFFPGIHCSYALRPPPAYCCGPVVKAKDADRVAKEHGQTVSKAVENGRYNINHDRLVSGRKKAYCVNIPIISGGIEILK